MIGLATSPTEGLWISVWTVGLFRLQNGALRICRGGAQASASFPVVVFCWIPKGRCGLAWATGVVMRRHEGKWTEFNRTNGLPLVTLAASRRGAR